MNFLILLNTILVAIIFVSLFLGGILLSNTKKRLSNIFLGIYLLLNTLQMTGHVIWYLFMGIARAFQYNSALTFSFAPLLFLHAQYLHEPKRKFRNLDFLHFTPTIVAMLLALNNVTLSPWHRVLVYLGVFVYSFLILRKGAVKKRNALKNAKSNLPRIVSWLQNITILFLLIVIFDLAYYLGFRIIGDSFLFVQTMVYLCILILVLYMLRTILNATSRVIIFGINKPFIFNRNQQEEKNAVYTSQLKVLEEYMNTNQPFLNPTLTLEQLSKEVDISKRDLSELINFHYQLNFVAYINVFRIELAKKMLVDPKDQKVTISEIMYAVGFNSKSSFNTLFKQNTGFTPSQYKKKNV